MSIEITLERIATALETIAKGSPAGTPVAMVPKAVTTKKTTMEAPKAPPVVVAEPDPFAPAVEQPEATVTIQQLEESLRRHAKAFGTPTTLALMVKHGADRAKTTIKSIPTTAYTLLAAEIESDLNKAK